MNAPPLVLSLFPGIDLLGLAFERAGFCVLRGPDVLFGGDIRDFHPPRGVFAGVIGGPPCQKHSTAGKLLDTPAADLIPEFVRCVEEARPDFVVMENVGGAVNHPAVPPPWHPARLRDWDCGGLTSRVRYFWTWPFWILEPAAAEGEPSLSVMASTARRGGGSYSADKGFLPGNLPIDQYETLQGVEPGHLRALQRAGASRYLCVHLLGNGVPLSMGQRLAGAAQAAIGARAAA